MVSFVDYQSLGNWFLATIKIDRHAIVKLTKLSDSFKQFQNQTLKIDDSEFLAQLKQLLSKENVNFLVINSKKPGKRQTSIKGLRFFSENELSVVQVPKQCITTSVIKDVSKCSSSKK